MTTLDIRNCSGKKDKYIIACVYVQNKDRKH